MARAGAAVRADEMKSARARGPATFVLLLASTLLGAGCSNSDEANPASPPACTKIGVDPAGAVNAQTGTCEAPLTAADCPEVLPDTPLGTASCDGPGERVEPFMFEDGGLTARGVFFTLGGSACVYDSQSHQLVGAWNQGDVQYFCCGRALERVAGQLPSHLVHQFEANVGTCF